MRETQNVIRYLHIREKGETEMERKTLFGLLLAWLFYSLACSSNQ
jgi:hypothetical protein